MDTRLTFILPETPITLAKLLTHRAWTLKSLLVTAPPIRELRSLLCTLKTGGVGRVRTRPPSLWGRQPTPGEAARTPAWCEGGGGWSAPVPWGPETWDPAAASGGQSGTMQAGEQLMVSSDTRGLFFFYGVDVSVSAHSWWRLLCLLAAWFSESVNELQCSSLLQKKGLCVCLMNVCVCVYVWCLCVGGGGGGGVMCLLLLMSHDFPAFTTLQKAVCLGESNEKWVFALQFGGTCG